MSYERQYYTNGDVLDARQMNHMETGIKENSDNIGKLSEDIATKASAIKEKESGEVIVVTDSAEEKPLGLVIDGKSEQNQYSGNQLFDYTTCKNGAINENGNYYELPTRMLSDYILVTSGTYTWSESSGAINFANFKKYDLNKSFLGSSETFDKTNSQSFEITEDIYIRLYFLRKDGADISVDDVKTIMFNKGNTALPLEPYCGGKPSPSTEYQQEITNTGKYDEASGKYAVEVKCNRGQLFDYTKCENKAYNENTNSYNETSNRLTSEYIPVKVGTYTITYPTSVMFLNFREFDADKNFIKTTIFNSTVGRNTISVKTDGFITLYLKNSDDSNIVASDLKDVMFNSGDTPLPLEPFEETKVTVLLDEPLRGIDEYEDCFCNQNGVWGTLRRIALADNSKWENVYANTSTLGHRYGNVLDDMLIKKDIRVLCSHYTQKTNIASFNAEGDYISTDEANETSRRINIRTLDNDFATAEEFKAYMIENNVETQYILAEPIFEPLADQTVLDGLSMFYPTTILSNDCNANMEVTYIEDTKAYIDKKFAELATAMV